MKYASELHIALEAAEKAGAVIREVYQKELDIHQKKDDSPVTEADLKADQVISEMIKNHFPNDGLLTEESQDDGSRFSCNRFWVVDPLDGTKEFIKKNDEFSVNIALVDSQEVVLGVVYLPVQDVFYYATASSGAYKKTKKNGEVKRLKVSDRQSSYRLLVSRSHPSPKTKKMLENYGDQIESITEVGSAIKGCLIAEGLHDRYYNFGHSMKWDTCAVECIVKEAGGFLRKINGESINYNEKETLNQGFFIVNHLNDQWILP